MRVKERERTSEKVECLCEYTRESDREKERETYGVHVDGRGFEIIHCH